MIGSVVEVKKNCLTTLNMHLAKKTLEEIISQGVSEFCLCPGARNAPLIYPLAHSSQIRLYYWPEERSAAFFALGRIKATGHPVAIVTTSGTAVAELLPAVMEAFYSVLPLVLITADRPRRFRGTGAPQTVNQVGLFGNYVIEMQDIADEEVCSLNHWTRQGPIHINVCFEEPENKNCQHIRLDSCLNLKTPASAVPDFYPNDHYLSFLHQTCFPLIIVGAMPFSQREAAVRYLLHLNAPVYMEGSSCIREDPRLQPLRITRIERIWSFATQHGYPIDGVLRLGGIPTARLWRDLEGRENDIHVCSISENSFSGLSYVNAKLIQTNFSLFFNWAQTISSPGYSYKEWKEADQKAYENLLELFHQEPLAEASLIHVLSNKIPRGSKIYLGNSLPIREWDQAATYLFRDFQISCSRGTNGIDGQLATFLGYSSPEQDNWSILGDLTILYDLVAPWITSQLSGLNTNVVVVNNKGAGIFNRMFTHSAFQNSHQLTFESLAQFWKWNYEKWESIPEFLSPSRGARLIELIPDPYSTERFLQRLEEI